MTGKLDLSMTAEELEAYLQEQRTIRLAYDRWKNRMWFRLVPGCVTSWDFRKIPAAKARAKAAEVGARPRARRRGGMASTRILLEGIEAEGRHGADPGERLEAQPFVVDLDVLLEVEGDTLDSTIDYRALADLARSTVASSSFELLESVAAAVAEAIFDLSAVLEVTATVHKPRAAESLGVEDVAAEVAFEVG